MTINTGISLPKSRRPFRALESGVQPGGKLIGKVKFRDSGRNDMLQLVDMTLGAGGAKLDGNDTWFDLIASKCVGLTCIPKKWKPDGLGAIRLPMISAAQSQCVTPTLSETGQSLVISGSVPAPVR
jgi:hypothetical protein